MTARLRLHRAVGSAFTRTYGVWGAGPRWLTRPMTRVGYGDEILVTLAGRIIALVWMFDGMISAAERARLREACSGAQTSKAISV